MQKMKLVAVLILLPLFLGLFGAWELQRSADNGSRLVQDQAELAELLPQLREMASKNKNGWIEINDQRVGVELALSRVGEAEHDILQLLSLERIKTGIAWSVVGLGLLAALVGTLGLLALGWAASRALESRKRLLHTFTLISRILPFLLVGHIVAMTAAVAAVLVFEGLGLWHVGRMSAGEFKLMAVAFITGLVCLYSIWTMAKQLKVMLHMFEPSGMVVLGHAVTPQQAPLLWDIVRELAQRLGALQPDHIVLGMADGFYVTSSDVSLLPSDAHLSGRTLHVPIMYLGLLDDAQTRAVIGHELAHFAGADTEYSLRFLPIYDGISRSLQSIFQTMLSSDLLQRTILRPALMLGLHFMESFDHAVNHWSRVRELAADAAGARMADNEAAGSALLRISAIDPLLQERVWGHVGSATNPVPGYVLPTDLPGAVLQALSEQALTLSEDELAVQLPHPSDTHPSNGERLASLHVTVEDAAKRSTHPIDAVLASAAMDRFFTDPSSVRARLTEDFLSHYVTQDAAVVEELKTYAGNVSGDVLLYEGARKRGIIATAVFGSLLLTGLALLAVGYLHPQLANGKPQILYVTGAILAVLMACLLPMTLRLVMRARIPALKLTPDHFVFANLKAPLAIQHVADFGLTLGNGLVLNVLLEDDAPLPEVTSGSFFAPNAQVIKKKRWVQLQLIQFCRDDRKLKPEELAELIGTYLNAGTARHLLAQRSQQTAVT
ncbi:MULTISPECIES: M48 family metallopeptidase [unclassified Pseudomonas]|uniref:M48 family metallopeptidase n=1 Tax=unclassified Pseudomonas TaxID=196821 RepID=UPI000D3CACC8|nr:MULTISPECIES: M48 family metallopeptidase [unclassified Pseudomonas]RAU47861.1 peptidase M48 [Pseudomonas sp. RIT 409]RAU55445.1 peptidase M48 [Pseudomonas sp. RIT 412]